MQDMKTELSKIGTSTMYPLGAIGRYRPNKAASNSASDVNEFLIVVERPSDQPAEPQRGTVGASKPIIVESYA